MLKTWKVDYSPAHNRYMLDLILNEKIYPIEISKEFAKELGDSALIDSFIEQTYINENKRLKSENAAMRKQISEMLTPLCTLGDKLYHCELSFGEGFDENGKVIYTSSMDIIETEVTKDNIWLMCDLVQNKRAFFSKEALVASYKERFEKESD